MEKIDQTSFEELRKDNADRLHELDVLAGGGDLRGTETTERTIRAGIDRFCRGTTQTDGSWTVVNLVEETGVPRPTLYRTSANSNSSRILAHRLRTAARAKS